MVDIIGLFEINCLMHAKKLGREFPFFSEIFPIGLGNLADSFAIILEY